MVAVWTTPLLVAALLQPATSPTFPDLTWLRAEIKAGRIGFLGEITSQYAAMPPTDPRLEPYFALAEELNVPVGDIFYNNAATFLGLPELPGEALRH